LAKPQRDVASANCRAAALRVAEHRRHLTENFPLAGVAENGAR